MLLSGSGFKIDSLNEQDVRFLVADPVIRIALTDWPRSKTFWETET